MSYGPKCRKSRGYTHAPGPGYSRKSLIAGKLALIGVCFLVVLALIQVEFRPDSPNVNLSLDAMSLIYNDRVPENTGLYIA